MISIGNDGETYPATVVLHMSDDSLTYEWSEAVIYRHDETGYYAFDEERGCSCWHFGEHYTEEYFRDELVWSPELAPIALQMSQWVRNLENASERMGKYFRIHEFTRSESMKRAVRAPERPPLPRKPKRITKRSELVELAAQLGVRHDWHEPDEQGVDAEVAGVSFDNAGFWPDSTVEEYQEMYVEISKNETVVATVNLATLFAWATGLED